MRREILFTFCIAQKVTKRLVTLKTRLVRCTIALLPVLLARLTVFHFLFLSIDTSHCDLSWRETDHPRSSNNLE